MYSVLPLLVHTILNKQTSSPESLVRCSTVVNKVMLTETPRLKIAWEQQ